MALRNPAMHISVNVNATALESDMIGKPQRAPVAEYSKNHSNLHSPGLPSERSAEGYSRASSSIGYAPSDSTRASSVTNTSSIQSDMNEYTKIVNPDRKPTNNLNLGRKTYSLIHHPQLFVVEVSLFTKKSAQGEEEPVSSRKLRSLAIEEFLGDVKLTDIRLNTVRDFRAGKGKVNLIIPICNLDHEKIIGKIFQRTEHVSSVKKIAKRLNQETIGEDMSVVCAIRESGQILTADDTPKRRQKYWKSLDIVIRARASCTKSWKAGIIDREFFLPLREGASSELEALKPFKVQISNQPSIDGDIRKLHLDFHLVPVLPDGLAVHEILLQTFGSAIVGSILVQNLTMIKHMLLGLQVRRGYKLAEKQGNVNTGATEADSCFPNPSPRRKSPAIEQVLATDQTSTTDLTSCMEQAPRQCFIKDVKLLGDIPKFLTKDNQDRIRMFSVPRYFNEKILKPKQQELQYETIPLANIGRDVWIPLEMLLIDGQQALKRSSHLTSKMRSLAKTYETRDGQADLKQAGTDFVHKVSLITFDGSFAPVNLFEVIYDDSGITQSNLTSTRSKFNKKTTRPSVLPEKMAIIYVKHVIVSKPDINLLGKVRDGLSYEREINFVPDTMINGEEDLVHQRNLDNVRNIDLIFAIVDDEGRSEREVKNILAELHKFAERKEGAVVVFTRKKSLERIYRNNRSVANYFPSNLLRKMAFMTGGVNFTTTPLLPKPHQDQDNIMIVGAHISHPSPRSTKHCPSVAAIVASYDQNATHYPGSARLQQTIRSTEKRGGNSDKLRYKIESNIVHLEDMMKERFELWKKKGNQPPNGVVFYRDAISFNNMDANEDRKEIEKAYIKTFGATRPWALTYIIVNRSTKIENLHEQGNGNPEFGFTTEEHDGSAKYQYYVINNGLKFEKEELKSFTIRLNESSQLFSDRVKHALPVHYAHKLCDRMFCYFRFHLTRDYGSVPAVIRATPDTDFATQDLQMVTYVNTYLEVNAAKKSAQPQTSTQISVAERQGPTTTVRKLPWQSILDDRMFYL